MCTFKLYHYASLPTSLTHRASPLLLPPTAVLCHLLLLLYFLFHSNNLMSVRLLKATVQCLSLSPLILCMVFYLKSGQQIEKSQCISSTNASATVVAWRCCSLTASTNNLEQRRTSQLEESLSGDMTSEPTQQLHATKRHFSGS